MRLLQRYDTGKIALTQFSDEDVPPYAILSHTWGADAAEVTFEDLMNGTGKDKLGYKKIWFCAEQTNLDGLQYFWIDTCCIDKRSSTELSEAINSMYRWYQDAIVCYAYLADVPSKTELPGSRWFSRGWTLQELLAPSEVIFFDEEWKNLGTRTTIQKSVSSCTGIPEGILTGSDDLGKASIAQRMSWAARRETKRLEDRAYCLMGIFGINMPLLYGEGERAFLRLQEEIMKISDDHSLFAWRSSDNRGGLLATSAASFKDSRNIVQSTSFDGFNSPLTMSSRGIYLEVRFMGRGPQGLGLAILHCKERSGGDKLIAIYIRDLFLTMEKFSRVWSEDFEMFDRRRFRLSQYPIRRICIQTGRLISKTHQNCGGIAPDIYPDDVLKDLMSFDEPKSLLRAAKRGLEEVVWLLLTRSDMEVNLEDSIGLTALTHAVLGGYTAVVRILLARSDVKTDLKDKYGLTPLWWAARMKNDTLVKVLLKSGKIDVDSRNECGQTLLSWAIKEGHEATINILLDEGADLESRDSYGRTPLSWAAEKGHKAFINMLLEKGADLESRDSYGWTPLSWAARKGCEAVVNMLLEKGADLESRNRYGWTPLSRAAHHENKAVADLLLEKSTGLQLNGKHYDQEQLLVAAKYGHEEIVRPLLRKSEVDVNFKDMNDQTPLFWAAFGGHLIILECLLQAKADVNAAPVNYSGGGTALQAAAARGHLAIVERLLQAKADVNAAAVSESGRTALQAAAARGHLAIVERLLQKRADVNAAAANHSGRTALQAAAEGGHLAVVGRLLQKWADVNAAAA
jgi:ankyrin repeat protein